MVQKLGLGKTKFNSSVCLLIDQPQPLVQIWLTERLIRQKSSGAWPSLALTKIIQNKDFLINFSELDIAENRDVERPDFFEDFYDEQFPFYEFLKKNNLHLFTKKFNSSIKYITHHEAHAYSALAFSPFEKSLIVVLDGAGSSSREFSSHEHKDRPDNSHEECSVYTQNKGSLELIHKRWLKFEKSQKHPEQTFSKGIGTLYEKAAEFIFNCSTSSGKVMGLAPFGEAQEIKNRLEFLEDLPWNQAFSGKTKKDWEESTMKKFFCDLAATVQLELEKDYEALLIKLKKQFPDYDNLILAGGCALNCTNNAKISTKNLFKEIYVVPFPGDESIAFGLANALRFKEFPLKWMNTSLEEQSAYLGPLSSVPTNELVESKLKEHNIDYIYVEDLILDAVQELKEGKIIGWFQGRSESGPRALGNRSILARADRAGLKNYLNEHIKFRESFRPYGCSILHERTHEYFEVEEGFDNPFMSFAIKVKDDYREILSEVIHVDGTSRMQAVRRGQNELFYKLIKKFGEETNLFCLLNTSLNIMGEPIVETIEDAINFFKTVPVDSMYVGQFKLERKNV
jgi:carbamoyltransferase